MDSQSYLSSSASVIWRWLDAPGLEFASLEPATTGWRMSGAASFAHQGQPTLLRYFVACDQAWRTREAWVEGIVAGSTVRHVVEKLPNDRWSLDGRAFPELDGCIDVDLNFSPITNLLPIRRLSLPVGEEAVVNAAWLRFPSFRLEKLDQIYRRTGVRTYQYKSAGGSFHADLTVDDHGIVRHYPPRWARA